MSDVLYFRPNGSSNIMAVKTGPGNYLVLPVGGVPNGPVEYIFTQENPYEPGMPYFDQYQPQTQPQTVMIGDGKPNPLGTVILGKMTSRVKFNARKSWYMEYAETYPPETTTFVDATIRPDLVATMTRMLAFGGFPKGVLVTFEQRSRAADVTVTPL